MTKKLNLNKTDILVSSTNSILGAVPFAGPLLSELVNNLIPNQRIDRLIKYVKELEERLSIIENKKIEITLMDEEGIDLLEEGFIQASRAITDERRKYIANIIANSIDNDEIQYSESKYVLKLIQELNEQEIIWLRYFMVPTINGDEDFRNKHSHILNTIQTHIGSDPRTLEKASLQDSYKEHLERIGLIRSYYRKDFKTGTPEFDKFTGRPSVIYQYLTPLGKMVLNQIGYKCEDDKNNANE